DLEDIQIDAELVPQVPALMARQHSCTPLLIDDGVLLMASPNLLKPEVEEELRLRLGVQVRTVLCTAAPIHAVGDRHFPKEAAQAELACGGAAKVASKTKGPSKPAAGTSGKKEQAAEENPYAAPTAEADPEEAKLKQQKQMTAAIVGIIVFVIAAVVLNF